MLKKVPHHFFEISVIEIKFEITIFLVTILSSKSTDIPFFNKIRNYLLYPYVSWLSNQSAEKSAIGNHVEVCVFVCKPCKICFFQLIWQSSTYFSSFGNPAHISVHLTIRPECKFVFLPSNLPQREKDLL